VATTFNNIGVAYDNKGEYEKALEYYQKGLDIQAKTLGDHHPNLANTYHNIGVTLDNKGDYDKAIEFYQIYLDIQIKTLGEQHPKLGPIYSSIGFVWRKKGRFDKALEMYKLKLEIEVNNQGNQCPSVATTNFYIGDCQRELQMYSDAIISLKAGYAIEKKGGYPFRIAQCHEALAEKPQALDYYIQSAEIRKNDPDLGIEAEATQESIKSCIRLAKELGKVGELPEWMVEV
jgi:tetratricopeptide (TPR) repeat protein